MSDFFNRIPGGRNFMGIDKINSIEPIGQYSKNNKVSKSQTVTQFDSISLSAEAQRTAEIQKVASVVRATEDVRMDRVNEVKAKLDSGAYDNNIDILTAVADSILSQWKI